MKHITWYFDFISPYAYLQSARLMSFSAQAEFKCVPVLFAGLLNHWGQKGPAEVPPKKTFTFRQCVWRARRDNIPYHTPLQHPFNPLRALRLSIALGNKLKNVQAIFQCIWVDGSLPDNDEGWKAIQKALNIDDGDARIAEPSVKAALVKNGNEAISAGVFGVPTCCIDREIFWGDDCLDMVADYLSDPGILEIDDIKRIDSMDSSAVRR